MPFDSTGLTPKESTQILEELNEDINKNLKELTGDKDAIIDTSVRSPMGRLNKIMADRLSEIWSTAVQIEDSMRVDKASGSSLERLARLVGFLRGFATPTIGDLRFTGDDGTLVPAGSIFSSVQGDQFSNPSEVVISLTNCYQFNAQISVIKNSRAYTIRVDNTDITVTSPSSGSTNQSILTQLETAINSSTEISVTATVKIDAGLTEDQDYYLEVVNDNQLVTMNIVVSPLVTTSSVVVEGLVESVEVGAIFGAADTVTTIVTSLNGLDSVNNPDDFLLGQSSEEDESLRNRISTDYNVVGSGTPSTIQAIFNKHENVRSVFVEENRTYVTSATGIPGKHYEIILSYEGDVQVMADLIWATKPTVYETHGDIPVTVKDASNEDQTVYLSEATDLFVYFKIDGTTLPVEEGEALPTDYESIIQERCVVEGDTYEINQDVFGKRFYGIIYGSVPGIDDLTVQVHLSSTPVPDINTITDWRDSWEVGRKEISTFGIGSDRFLINIV